jgi:hypothetical protein
MPLTPEWAIFFSAELAALATLTGLVVVAISTNLPRILSYGHLPTRAGEALIGPVGAIIVTSLMLIPEQAPMLLGAEVILIGRYMRAVSTTGFSLPFAIGGALVFEGPEPAFIGSPLATFSASLRSCSAAGC